MIDKKLKKLFKYLKINNVDGYVVPKNDEFFNEYANPNRLFAISNFSGSAGLSIITKKNNYLFVDGRYTAQAKLETKGKFKIFEIPRYLPSNILYRFENGIKIGYDPKLFTQNMLLKYFGKKIKLIAISENLIDKIDRQKNFEIKKPFYSLNTKITGENISLKIKRIVRILNKRNIDNLFITAPENSAWLLNIRGFDNPHSPIPNCRVIITKDKKIYVFSDLEKIRKIKKNNIYKNIKFKKFNDLFEVINKLKYKNFAIDALSCSIYNQCLIKSKFEIISLIDPCYELKAIKNKTEIYHTKKAHIEDGAALSKFLYWIQKKNINKLTELDVIKKLENFRKKNNNYLFPSFDTIAGSGPNGAIIHYRANKKTNRLLNKKHLLLIDSGGQYKYGTTDVTRTICFNKPSKQVKDVFTRVLKGHIAVTTSNLSKIKNGSEVDLHARKYLKQIGLDYKHGTGHGVGFFLNVHEGPQSISSNNLVPLKEGMILSNEPGYYKTKSFGIRIENLIFINKKNKKLFFENLTLAPIDTKLINFNFLNKKEKKYLSDYNINVYNKLSKYMNINEKKWLKSLI